MQKRVTVEEYLATPFVTDPLHLLDYCLINDGGVAFILMSAERARRGARKPAVIHGIGRHDLSREATSLVPRLTDFYRPAQGKVAEQVFNMAGVNWIGSVLDAAAKDPEVMATLRESAFAADSELIAPMMQWKFNGQPAGNGPLDQVAEGYRAMDERRAIKTLLRP